MESHSSTSSTETSRSISQRSKPTRAARWSFFTRCGAIAASQRTQPNNACSERECAVRKTCHRRIVVRKNRLERATECTYPFRQMEDDEKTKPRLEIAHVLFI